MLREPSPRLLVPPFDNLWSRVARRRYALGLGRSIWPIVFVIGLAVVGGMSLWSEFLVTSTVSLYLMMFPITVVMNRLRTARPVLTSELMRPTSRHDCITEIGLVIACEQVMTWFVIVAIYVVVSLCLHTDSVPWSTIAITGAAQVPLFGLLAWCSRYNSMWPTMFALWLPLGVGMPASQLIPLFYSINEYALLAAIVIFVILGVLLTHAARQRWMQTDVT